MKKWIRVIGWGLMAAGLVVLGFLAYQYWYTDLAAARGQQEGARQLAIRLAEVEVEVEAEVAVEVTPSGQPDANPRPNKVVIPPTELFTEEPPEPGTAFAEVRIPSIEVDEVVFEGVDVPTLQLGPGHMPWTPLPGQPGNAVMSGHRTTYGAPFNRIDELSPGDKIVVISAVGRHVYKVRETLVVEPTDIWVTDPRSGGWLTLTTCHPEFSAQERYIVHAEMVKGPNLRYIRANPDHQLAAAQQG
ncbi:MAG TPA: class E sortase [Acidimicrobiia bacterium]|nr:class E sortase [Acidimicrobiia bacterium]